MKREFKGNVLLLLTAMIWGAAFVAQSVSMDHIGPFTFQATRSALGALVLLPVIFIMDRKNGAPAKTHSKAEHKTLWRAGLICGLVFTVASNIQQIGICYTTAGKAGFITAMYIVLVPIAGLLFRRRPGWNTWAGVVLAVGGLYLLCVKSGFSIGRGDVIVFFSAIAFTVHILVIDHYSPLVDGVRLSCIQFAVCAVLSGVIMLVREQPSPAAIAECYLPIAYAGVMSCGVAYTFQIIGQKYTNPTVASLLMSLESVFAALFGWLLLHEALSARELGGCLLMFAAIVLAQLPIGKKQKA